MTCKTIEIRDVGTFIPALAIRLDPEDTREQWLLARAGFGETVEQQRGYILLYNLVKDAPYDPFAHGRARTLGVIHQYLLTHFDRILNGAVLDAEHILGESSTPKVSEQRRGEL